ncbi:hypothetical protein [Streptomyces sp. NPDC000851]
MRGEFRRPRNLLVGERGFAHGESAPRSHPGPARRRKRVRGDLGGAQSTDDSTVRFFAQKHGALQNERALLNQVEALLTACDPREFLDGRQELTVDVPDAVDGTDCHVEVTADDDRLLLSAGAEDAETGRTGGRKTLRNLGAGRYDTHLTLPGPGTWRVTVGDPVNAGRVHEVSSVVPAAQP